MMRWHVDSVTAKYCPPEQMFDLTVELPSKSRRVRYLVPIVLEAIK
jgi:hypothetical protein